MRKKKSEKHPVKFTGNTDVDMYGSPAYDTHQIFTEPGLDHLYEPIDHELCEEKKAVQDTAFSADDNEVDTEGYLKMTPSGEVVVNQAFTEGTVDDTGSHSGNSEATNEYCIEGNIGRVTLMSLVNNHKFAKL